MPSVIGISVVYMFDQFNHNRLKTYISAPISGGPTCLVIHMSTPGLGGERLLSCTLSAVKPKVGVIVFN
jgi:hypothetical protein